MRISLDIPTEEKVNRFLDLLERVVIILEKLTKAKL